MPTQGALRTQNPTSTAMAHSMRAAWLTICLLVGAALVSAHRIDIAAGKKECYFEDLHQEDQVGSGSRVGEG